MKEESFNYELLDPMEELIQHHVDLIPTEWFDEMWRLALADYNGSTSLIPGDSSK